MTRWKQDQARTYAQLLYEFRELERGSERLREALQRILKGTSKWGQENDALLDAGEIHDLAANALLAGIDDTRIPVAASKHHGQEPSDD